jgi:hypothetical protein
VCSQSANTYDLFIRGADNAVWWRHWSSTTGQSAWQSLGGKLTSSPGAASSGSGNLYVAVRGTDGALWTRFTANGGVTWSRWSSAGGKILEGTGPAAFYVGTSIYYGVTGTNHALYCWNGVSWNNLGGYLTSSPSAAVLYGYPGYIYLCARGNDSALWARYGNPGLMAWNAWKSFGGKILEGTGPAGAGVIRGGYDTFTLFVIGTNHQLYWYVNTYWVSLGGYLTSSPAAASASDSASTFDVFAVGRNGGDIWSRGTTNGGDYWNPWYKVPW